MSVRILYFAYGSNMNRARMRQRCPYAKPVGRGVLNGWRLRERLYADIDRDGRCKVEGMVYEITLGDLMRLDRFEGFPKVYTTTEELVRLDDGRMARCLVYKMTHATAAEREGAEYPAWYRAICSEGARQSGVRDGFAVNKKGK